MCVHLLIRLLISSCSRFFFSLVSSYCCCSYSLSFFFVCWNVQFFSKVFLFVALYCCILLLRSNTTMTCAWANTLVSLVSLSSKLQCSTMLYVVSFVVEVLFCVFIFISFRSSLAVNVLVLLFVHILTIRSQYRSYAVFISVVPSLWTLLLFLHFVFIAFVSCNLF